MSASGSAERPYGRTLATLTVLALALRLVLIGAESFWFDEIWAVKQARLSAADLLVDLRENDVHPPLWPLLLHVWTSLFGEAEWVVRLPSALAGAAAVPLFASFVRRLGGDAWALRAAALLAVSSYAVDFSQEARAYALLLALSAASLDALWGWIAAPEARWRGALWAVLAALMLYTHVFGAFVALAQGLYVLFWVPRLRLAVVVAGGAALALYAPWVPSQLVQVSRVQEDFWIEPIRWSDPLYWAWHWAGYSFGLAAGLAALVVLGVVGAPAPARRIFGLLAATVLGLPALLSVLGQPMFQPKYAIAILIPLFALVALGTSRLRWPRAAFGGVVGVLLVVLVLGTYRHTGKEQYRELGALADSAAAATLVTEPGMLPYVSYYTRAPIATDGGATGPVRLLLAHPTGESPLERTLAARCRRGEEMVLVGARAVDFDCSQGQ